MSEHPYSLTPSERGNRDYYRGEHTNPWPEEYPSGREWREAHDRAGAREAAR